jgi:hypothetical protein
MSDELARNRDLTTADLATAAERAGERDPAEPSRPVADREVNVARESTSAADSPPEEAPMPLLSSDITERLRARWTQIQAGFVDEPRRAVEQADELVAEAIKNLAQSFANARASLEQEWSRGQDVDTEDLRVALRRYRAFFSQLLTR